MQVKVYSDFSDLSTLTINSDNPANGFHDVDLYGKNVYIYFDNQGTSEIQLTLAAVHIYSQRHHDATKMLLNSNAYTVLEMYPQDNTATYGYTCYFRYGYSNYGSII